MAEHNRESYEIFFADRYKSLIAPKPIGWKF
jgi:hypothetical protein